MQHIELQHANCSVITNKRITKMKIVKVSLKMKENINKVRFKDCFHLLHSRFVLSGRHEEEKHLICERAREHRGQCLVHRIE